MDIAASLMCCKYSSWPKSDLDWFYIQKYVHKNINLLFTSDESWLCSSNLHAEGNRVPKFWLTWPINLTFFDYT